MLSKVISLGDRIELKKVGSDNRKKEIGDEPDRIYVSQVYDIVSEDELKIAMPIVDGRIVPLPLNGRFDLCFYTSHGLYQCRATITDRYKEDGLFVLQIEITTDLKKFQRRQYFRLECTLDLLYRILPKEEVLEIITNKDSMQEFLHSGLEHGVALDISGGGMRFTSKQKHSLGDCIIIVIKIKKGNENVLCVLPGTIIRSGKISHRDDVFEHRVEYNNLQGAVRETLIKFIFEEERRLRQKEKG